jgi:hypothetical protein
MAWFKRDKQDRTPSGKPICLPVPHAAAFVFAVRKDDREHDGVAARAWRGYTPPLAALILIAITAIACIAVLSVTGGTRAQIPTRHMYICVPDARTGTCVAVADSASLGAKAFTTARLTYSAWDYNRGGPYGHGTFSRGPQRFAIVLDWGGSGDNFWGCAERHDNLSRMRTTSLKVSTIFAQAHVVLESGNLFKIIAMDGHHVLGIVSFTYTGQRSTVWRGGDAAPGSNGAACMV